MSTETVTRWWVQPGAETTPVMESTQLEVHADGTEEVVAVSNVMPDGAHEITEKAAERLTARSRLLAKEAISEGRWPIPGTKV